VTLILGLAIATALWSGVQAINAEARKSYDAASRTLGLNTLERLTGPRVTIENFTTLRRAGWQVSPVVDGTLRGSGLRVLGIDPLSAPMQAGLAGLMEGSVDLTAFLTPPRMLLTAPETVSKLAKLDLPVTIQPQIAPGTVLTDIGVAQKLLNTSDLSYLLLEPVQARDLPPLHTVTNLNRTTPENGTDIARLTDSFHLNLTAFGFLSFAVGLFIVQSAIGLAFEQRRSTFRTLRALGVGSRQLIRMLALELLGIALIAGAIGLVLGYGIAAALLPGVSGTLRGLYGAQVSGTLAFDPTWAISALAMTILGSAAAGSLAIWRVAHLPLLAAARPRAWALASRRQLAVQLRAGLCLLVTAFILAFVGTGLLAGFACLAALLLGAALSLPSLLMTFLNILSRGTRSVLGEWVLADARQQVPSLSLALMALMIALATNIGVGTMVGSFRTTFTGWLDMRLASELYVTASSETQATEIMGYLQPRADAVLPIWSVDGQAQSRPADIFGIVDHATYRDHWPLVAANAGAWDQLRSGKGALINEQLARRAELWPGDTVSLGADWMLEVVGVYSDYGNPRAQAIVEYELLRSRYPDVPTLRFAIRIAADKADALRSDILARFDLSPDAVVDQARVKALSLEVFEQTFRVTGALNVLTLGVAGFAMLATLLTLSTMRLSQLAPVWALGLTPAWLSAFELIRTALLAVLTWVISVPVGLCLAWVLLSVVNVHAFGWLLPMKLFPLDWLVLGGWAMASACLAALWPALHINRGAGAPLLRRFADER